MKEQNGKEKKKPMSKEKRFYLFTAVGCAAVMLAIILVAVAITNNADLKDPTAGNPSNTVVIPNPDKQPEDSGTNEPVITTPDGMTMPLSTVSVLNDYGFYHNQTLNHYYEHKGVDFTAEVGAEVLAVDDGVVESIFSGDVLTGTEITVDHGDGVKSVYRFVNASESLSVGMKVKQGDVIGSVAEATGEEYKDGAHLHFEIRKDGKSVDPATYLTFEEK
ncbi:MAG: M23 family metallopeptidase [Clostridia bacterium]|nr:M23 family metallopeptidase [Clostridia bacterium]